MSHVKHSSPFPHFALSEEDVEQLQQLARALVASSFAGHEKFLRSSAKKKSPICRSLTRKPGSS